tara:strand:- start:103 stop:525 length:423 start_codon:yes stop_codon:yes gene_type:complete
MTSIVSDYLSITIVAGFTALSLNIIIYQQYKLSQMIDRLSSENHLLLTQLELAKTNTNIEEQHNTIATIRHKINDIEDGICVDYDMDEKDKTELLKKLKEKEQIALDHLIYLQEHEEYLQNDKIKCANRIRTFLMQMNLN